MPAVSDEQAPTEQPRWMELFAPEYARTTVGLVLLETVVAIQLLVTLAVLPAVVKDLGGIHLYGLALSAAGLATAVVLPMSGRLVARWGLRTVFLASVMVFAAGSLVVIAAPSMPVFVVGRLAQGASGGAQYVLMLAIFTRRYPLRLRPKMLAVWSTAWAVPGLVGPAYGGLVASTLGWRWAFGLLLPLLVPSVLLLRRDLSEGSGDSPPAQADPTGWPWLVTLALGMVGVFASLALGGAEAVWLGIAGLVPTVLALRAILPPGSFAARSGLAAVVATTFLSGVAFFAVEGFLPAMLTGVRGISLTVAGLVVTVGIVAWIAGTWWQSHVVARVPARRLVAGGACLVLVGIAGVWAGDLGAPLVLTYLAWGAAGFGMGVAFPTLTLLATDLAVGAHEVVALSQYQLSEVLGEAVGPALGGGAFSLALAAGLQLQDALSASFGVAVAGGLLFLATSYRLPALDLA